MLYFSVIFIVRPPILFCRLFVDYYHKIPKLYKNIDQNVHSGPPQIFKARKKAPHFCSIAKHYVNPVESTDHLESTSDVKVNTVFTEHEGHCPEICRQWTHLAISTLPGWPVKCFLSRDVILLRVFSSLCCKGLAMLWCFSCSTKRITCCSWPSCTHRGDVMLHCLYAVSSDHATLPPCY